MSRHGGLLQKLSSWPPFFSFLAEIIEIQLIMLHFNHMFTCLIPLPAYNLLRGSFCAKFMVCSNTHHRRSEWIATEFLMEECVSLSIACCSVPLLVSVSAVCCQVLFLNIVPGLDYSRTSFLWLSPVVLASPYVCRSNCLLFLLGVFFLCFFLVIFFPALLRVVSNPCKHLSQISVIYVLE